MRLIKEDINVLEATWGTFDLRYLKIFFKENPTFKVVCSVLLALLVLSILHWNVPMGRI